MSEPLRDPRAVAEPDREARGYKGSGPQMSEPLRDPRAVGEPDREDPRAAAEPENRSTRTTSVEGTALQDLIAGQAAGHRIIGTINLPVRAPPSSAKEPEPAAPVPSVSAAAPVSAASSPSAPQRDVGKFDGN